MVNVSPIGQCPGNCSVLLTHTGGDEIASGEYSFFINDNSAPVVPGNLNPDPQTNSWSVGKTIILNSSVIPEYIRIYYYNTTKVNNPALLGQRAIGTIPPTFTTIPTSSLTTSPTTSPTPTVSPTPAVYIINTTAGSGGTITPGNSTVNSGDNLTFSINPNSGYHIVDVKIDSTPIGIVSSYTFTNIHANHLITATFSTDYLLRVNTGDGAYRDTQGHLWSADQQYSQEAGATLLVTVISIQLLHLTTLSAIQQIKHYIRQKHGLVQQVMGNIVSPCQMVIIW